MSVETRSGTVVASHFDQIRIVYGAIVLAPWFHGSADRRQDCADLVMRHYRMGTTDPEELLRVCVEHARLLFEIRWGDRAALP